MIARRRRTNNSAALIASFDAVQRLKSACRKRVSSSVSVVLFGCPLLLILGARNTDQTYVCWATQTNVIQNVGLKELSSAQLSLLSADPSTTTWALDASSLSAAVAKPSDAISSQSYQRFHHSHDDLLLNIPHRLRYSKSHAHIISHLGPRRHCRNSYRLRCRCCRSGLYNHLLQ